MYLRYFGFESYPFSVTPDPAFLYLSASHREALAHLLYGAGEHGGFVSLIGEVGTGKTTLIRAVADSELADLDIALCWNPQLGVREFVATVCDELGVMPERGPDTSLKALVDRLNAHLLRSHAENRRTVLIVDEAQNLSRDVLEQLRLLTNLETHKHKLLRIILVGQPELADLLARHDLRQLAQRITARFVLRPLGYAETHAYVQHRLACANGPQHLFPKSATTILRAVTGGIPRLINMVCDRALMGAYAHGRSHVSAWTIGRAARESLPRKGEGRRVRWPRVAVPAGAVVVAALAIVFAGLPDIPLTNAAEWFQTQNPPGEVAQTQVTGQTDKTDKTAADPAEASADDVAGDTPIDAKEKHNVAAADAKKTTGTTAGSGNGHGEATSTDPSTDKDGKNAIKPAAQADGDQSTKTASSPDADVGSTKITQVEPTAAARLSTTLPAGSADMNQLLRLWGVFGSQIRSSCAALDVGDLRCLDDTGTLAELRQFNRPALLDINDDGQTRSLLLIGLQNGRATLVGDNGTRDVSTETLTQQWNGHFRIVWRADSGVRLIRPNTVGQAVVWLRRRLDEIDGQNPDTRIGQPSPIYDSQLAVRVRTFQKQNGLTPDGIAGPRTQMMLNSTVATPGTPHLATGQTQKTS